MPEQPRVHLVVHGCRVNQYEAQAMQEAWVRDGAALTNTPGKADVVVVLSCAVTSRAVADLRGALRRLTRKAPHAKRICAGCAPQAVPQELGEAAEGWTLISRASKAELLDLFRDAALPPPGVLPANSWPPFTVTGEGDAGGRSRATCKIQDGCNQACAYCIVPKARGGPVSRPEAATRAEISALLQEGYREIVLSGVNLGQYTGESGGLWALIRRIEAAFGPAWAGKARLRLSSLDPGLLTQEGLETLAASRLVCPHLHLSLQSGSQEVLSAMGRGHYRIADVSGWIDQVRRVFPTLALGADFLVGFPGESAEDFQATRDLFSKLPLTYAHVFPFSPRPGTRASSQASAGETLPMAERQARASILRELAAQRAQEFREALRGMPRLFMIVEERVGMDSLAGICEYAVRCRCIGVPEGPDAPALRSLLAVTPASQAHHIHDVAQDASMELLAVPEVASSLHPTSSSGVS